MRNVSDKSCRENQNTHFVFHFFLLRNIFGSKKEEVTGEWRKLHSEELHGLYSSGVTSLIIAMRMRWVGHVACLREERNGYRASVNNVKERDQLEDPSIKGITVLKLTLRNSGRTVWAGLIWHKIGTFLLR
jgi:hypothetical protein